MAKELMMLFVVSSPQKLMPTTKSSATESLTQRIHSIKLRFPALLCASQKNPRTRSFFSQLITVITNSNDDNHPKQSQNTITQNNNPPQTKVGFF
jgi:hypothetical protein